MYKICLLADLCLVGLFLLFEIVVGLGTVAAFAGFENHKSTAVYLPVQAWAGRQFTVMRTQANIAVNFLHLNLFLEAFLQGAGYGPDLAFGKVGNSAHVAIYSAVLLSKAHKDTANAAKMHSCSLTCYAREG